jgi:hypothetical protein
MNRFILPLLIILTALLGFGCDRFQHDFLPPVTVDFIADLFNPLQQAFTAMPDAPLENVMDFYADDYLQFGANKADRRNWLEGIFSVHPDADATVALLNSQIVTDSTAIANWRLTIFTPDKRGTLADSTFTGERLVKRSGQWLLKGNQMTCQLPTPLQHVIVDYFTFLTCPNCPIVETKLEELTNLYPDQLTYLEHHVNDQLSLPTDGTQAYYMTFSSPASIIQGKFRVLGNSEEVLESYDAIVGQLVQLDSEFRYTNPVISVDGQDISGSILLEDLTTDLDYTNLALKVVLIERVSQFNNAEGNPARNVVRALGRYNISDADLSQPYLFNLHSTVPIPDDASLVIYTQTLPDVFENNATIHGGIEIPLDIATIRH